ncbi:chondroitinase-B domain-containing protein [Paraflavitalea speifideaquila]|uniref:chondroitinase-B domain-containing protein n=1 Tax=Paraflavitalea speifideaquila TaxID=3076558 RepID=UPI0028EAA8F3|nr:chondroitinase-B domain-containing protein [Paraflavitalea speifideiaquila]
MNNYTSARLLSYLLKGIISSLLLLGTTVHALAKDILVKSLAALQTAINNAAPGDVITLANGVYTTTANISIQNSGTSSRPITIMAQKQVG